MPRRRADKRRLRCQMAEAHDHLGGILFQSDGKGINAASARMSSKNNILSCIYPPRERLDRLAVKLADGYRAPFARTPL